MSYKIIPTETFKTQVKTLQKKYPHIRQDLKDLSKRLKHNPSIGQRNLQNQTWEFRSYKRKEERLSNHQLCHR